MAAYADITQVAEHLGIAGNLAAGNMTSRLTLAVNAASRLIDQDCGRTFDSRTATKALVSQGGDVLHVPDLVSVTTLKVDDDADGTFETTLTTADYELNTWHDQDERWPTEYVVRVDDYWPTPLLTGRRQLVQIVGTWGWSAVPDEVTLATIILASRLFQRGNAALGVQGFSDFGPFSIRSTDPDVTALLHPFRKVVIL